MNKRATEKLIRNGDILATAIRSMGSSADPTSKHWLARWAGERNGLVRELSRCDQRAARSAKEVVRNVIRSAELRAALANRTLTKLTSAPKKRRTASFAFGFVGDPKIETEVFKIAMTAVSDRLTQYSQRAH